MQALKKIKYNLFNFGDIGSDFLLGFAEEESLFLVCSCPFVGAGNVFRVNRSSILLLVLFAGVSVINVVAPGVFFDDVALWADGS